MKGKMLITPPSPIPFHMDLRLSVEAQQQRISPFPDLLEGTLTHVRRYSLDGAAERLRINPGLFGKAGLQRKIRHRLSEGMRCEYPVGVQLRQARFAGLGTLRKMGHLVQKILDAAMEVILHGG